MKKWVGRVAMIAATFAIFSCASQAVRFDEAEYRAAREGAELAWIDIFSGDTKGGLEVFGALGEASGYGAEALRAQALSYWYEGKNVESAEACIEFLTRYPDSHYAVPMRAFLELAAPQLARVLEKVPAADVKLSKYGVSTWNTREGLKRMIEAAVRSGRDRSALPRLKQSLGIVEGWSVLGPFPNVSGLGVSTTFIDEKAKRLSKSQSVPGDGGRDVSWNDAIIESADGYVRLSEALSFGGYSVAYASAKFNVEEPGGYRFILDRSGAVKLWIDGELLFTDGSYGVGTEQYWVPKELKKGAHTVLVKVAVLEQRAEFRLSVIQAKDEENPSLKASETALAALVVGDSFLGSDPALGAAAAIAAVEGGIEDDFWLAFMLYSKGYYEQALAIAERYAEYAPFAYVQSLACLNLSRVSDARNALALSWKPKNPFVPSGVFLAIEAARDGLPQDAEAYIKAVKKARGSGYTIDYAEMEVALLSDDEEKRGEVLDSFWESYPDDVGILIDFVKVGNIYFAKDSKAKDIERAGLKAYYEYLLSAALADEGYLSDSLRIARSLGGLYLDRAEFAFELLRCQLFGDDSFDVEKFVAEAERYRSAFPYSYGIHRLWMVFLDNQYEIIKDLLRRASEKQAVELRDHLEFISEQLTKSLDALLVIDPYDLAFEDRIRELRGQASMAKSVKIPDPFQAIRDYEASGPSDSGDAVVVLDWRAEVEYRRGGSRAWACKIVKVLSQAGIENESQQEYSFGENGGDVEVVIAAVYRPDGSRREAMLASRHATFTGLQIGDYLVLLYQVQGGRYLPLARYFWTDTPVNGRNEVRDYQRHFYYEKTLGTPTFALRNCDGIDIERSDGLLTGGFSRTSFTAKNVRAYRKAPLVPPYKDFGAWIDASSAPSWAVIGDWYREHATGRALVTPRIEKKALELTAGAATRTEKIRAIYDYVAREIEYEDLTFMYHGQIPQFAESIMDDGTGDCKDKATLMIALLKAIGIDADITLSMSGDFSDTYYLPSSRFNHAILSVNEPDGSYFILDPTSATFTYPELPYYLDRTWALRIPRNPEGKAELERLSAPERPRSAIALYVEPGESTYAYSGSMLLSGSQASLARYLFSSHDDDSRKVRAEYFAAGAIRGFKLSEFSTGAEESLAEFPSFSFKGEGLPLKASAGKLALDGFWFVKMNADYLLINPGRSQAAAIEGDEYATPVKQTVVIKIPSGYQVSALPADATYRFRDAYASYSFRTLAGNVVMERELFVPGMTIPTADLAAFVDFAAAATAKEAEAVYLERRR